MPKDLTMGMDDMELTCLDIMNQGEDMIAMGAWEAPIKRMAMKEWCQKIDNGYRITDKGRAVLAKSDGVLVDALVATAPPRPDWIATELPGGGLVIVRKNELAVSGYEALAPRWVPIVHEQANPIDTIAIRDNVDGFLQTMMDLAWAKGMRPTGG